MPYKILLRFIPFIIFLDIIVIIQVINRIIGELFIRNGDSNKEIVKILSLVKTLIICLFFVKRFMM